ERGTTMMRTAVCALSALCLLLTAGCSQQPPAYLKSTVGDGTVENPYGLSALYQTGLAPPLAPQDAAAVPAPPAGGALFPYAHAIRLDMERAAIKPRFERARDACLNDTALSCTLITSNLNIDENQDYPFSFAQLVVLLPHEKVDGYADALLEPV